MWLNIVGCIGDNVLPPILTRKGFLSEEISTVAKYEQAKVTEEEVDLHRHLCDSMFWVGMVFGQLITASREVDEDWPWPIRNNIVSACDECLVLYSRDIGLDVPLF